MSINPIGTREFRKLLANGMVAEMCVMDAMNNFVKPVDLGWHSMAWDTTDEVVDDAMYDLAGVGYDMSPEGMLENEMGFSVEVKQADNDGRYKNSVGDLTFFAECIQTGTNGYPEYLVSPPDIMAYYNKAAHFIYFYDGKKFAEAVKERFAYRFLIKRGTAEGIKFGATAQAFGFLHKVPCYTTRPNIIEKYKDRLNERLNAPNKKVRVHKQCDGLEDLV